MSSEGASWAASQFSPWFMLQTNSVSCVCSPHSPDLVYHWRPAGDRFCFSYAIMLYVYFSEMSTRQQRMMLKIIQINSFLFLLIRPSPNCWMTVNRIMWVFFFFFPKLRGIPSPWCLMTWVHIHNLPGGVDLVLCHLCLSYRHSSRCLKTGLSLRASDLWPAFPPSDPKPDNETLA